METTESWLGQQWRRFGRGIIIGIVGGFIGYLGMCAAESATERDRQRMREEKAARVHEEAELKQLGQGVCRDLSVLDDPDHPRRMFACPHPHHMLHSESWGYVCLCIKQPQ